MFMAMAQRRALIRRWVGVFLVMSIISTGFAAWAQTVDIDCLRPNYSSDSSFSGRLSRLGLHDDAEVEIMRLPDEESFSINMYNLAYQRYKSNEIRECIKSLATILNTSTDKHIREDSYRLIILSEVIDGNLNAANKYMDEGLREFQDLFSVDDTDIIEAIVSEDWSKIPGLEKPGHRSVLAARIFSILLPGTGQMFCGEYFNGARSAALNGTLGYITVAGFANGYYARALTVFYFFGARYWVGGSETAARFADQFNSDETKKAAFAAIGEIEWCGVSQ